MPRYTMKHKQTGEVKEMILSLSEREEILSQGEWEQTLATPNFVQAAKSPLRMAGSGWGDVLGKVKSGSGRGNTINN